METVNISKGDTGSANWTTLRCPAHTHPACGRTSSFKTAKLERLASAQCGPAWRGTAGDRKGASKWRKAGHFLKHSRCSYQRAHPSSSCICMERIYSLCLHKDIHADAHSTLKGTAPSCKESSTNLWAHMIHREGCHSTREQITHIDNETN